MSLRDVVERLTVGPRQVQWLCREDQRRRGG